MFFLRTFFKEKSRVKKVGNRVWLLKEKKKKQKTIKLGEKIDMDGLSGYFFLSPLPVNKNMTLEKKNETQKETILNYCSTFSYNKT